MKYSLGPIQYYWERNLVYDFYEQAKDSGFDCIYLGESVCSKRKELKTDEWIDLAKELSASNKEVVLTSMALIMAQSELSTLKRICSNGQVTIEANDLGAVQFLAENGVPFVLGAAINIYNQVSLKQMINLGMKRWVMPVELSRAWLQEILAHCSDIRDQLEVEIYGYGHLPLAYSARCFTARSENKPKDQCEKCCIHYPNGRLMKSQEGQKVFVINGIQTMTGKCNNLILDQNEMNGMVDLLRLSPEGEEVFDVLNQFKSDNQTIYDSSIHCNGYWRALPGMDTYIETELL